MLVLQDPHQNVCHLAKPLHTCWYSKSVLSRSPFGQDFAYMLVFQDPHQTTCDLAKIVHASWCSKIRTKAFEIWPRHCLYAGIPRSPAKRLKFGQAFAHMQVLQDPHQSTCHLAKTLHTCWYCNICTKVFAVWPRLCKHAAIQRSACHLAPSFCIHLRVPRYTSKHLPCDKDFAYLLVLQHQHQNVVIWPRLCIHVGIP